MLPRRVSESISGTAIAERGLQIADWKGGATDVEFGITRDRKGWRREIVNKTGEVDKGGRQSSRQSWGGRPPLGLYAVTT